MRMRLKKLVDGPNFPRNALQKVAMDTNTSRTRKVVCCQAVLTDPDRSFGSRFKAAKGFILP